MRGQILHNSKMSAYTNVLATLSGDLGLAENAVKDAERALELAQFALYKSQRSLADAHRTVYEKRQEINVTKFQAMQAWLEEGKTEHAPGSIASLLN
jgi:hypothetical protein